MKNTLLWLDDVRNPNERIWMDWMIENEINPFHYEIVWVKNYIDFTNWIKENGFPSYLCFDHDLGQDEADMKVKMGMSKRQSRKEKKGIKDGMDCAHFVVNYSMDNDLDLPKWAIQSANPVGAENIKGLLTSYTKFRKG